MKKLIQVLIITMALAMFVMDGNAQPKGVDYANAPTISIRKL